MTAGTTAGTSANWPQLLSALLRGEQLTAEQTAAAMGSIMAGEATGAQIAGFAVALRAKGETSEELAGLVRTMLAHAAPLSAPGPVVDTCGTGGDLANTVNISTMAAIVVAGTGATVVKHGNRAASSACGTADVLEELGVVVDLQPAAVASCIQQAGIGFCFAPVFHPALRHAAPPRRELGVPTVFNFLGPLTNPARPAAQALGVPDARMAPVMAGVLAERGTSALVFRGEDGLDELSVSGPSRIWSVLSGSVVEQLLDPADLGLTRSNPEALLGGDAAFNAGVVRAVLAGERGAVRDAVLLNAAAALVALGRVGRQDAWPPEHGASLAEELSKSMDVAGQAVDSGAAARALDRWVQVSRDLRPG